ncbi:TPA: glycoside hydrolase family 28 protein [Citrobacter freundii]|uniref:glycoside hydrolase family 28 protein n=1 Tax=Citrobacter amalonaticus TaxID=35703 RepID=UPI0019064D4B|nr:glycoside hydrolase family 28 protein [Citrobacter amalonaticus]MBJ9278239.1 glycoside hydrolase family 28 protein [Citrobacter amalonaticus]HAT6803409.1 glycoside hydrolase family 28 protein [Citrobacter freundii]HAU5063986.1 glycoside hydrolase family 28 protein [Citrobacter amalonaticus]
MSVQLDVKDFGATGDGLVKDTHAVQRAIDSGAAQGVPVVISPGTYLVGSLFLKEGSQLHFAQGATLLGSPDIADYPEIPTRVAGVEMIWPAAIVNAIEVNNIVISGHGRIDGQGAHWWDLYYGPDKASGLRVDYDNQGLRWIADYLIKRPRACLIYKAENVAITDLTFERAGFWNLQITYANNVVVSGVTIRDNHGPSTDGIDIDSSRHVRVTQCDVSCGDDCIVIKSGRDGDGYRVGRIAEHIEIDHCIIRSGYGVTLGSEVSGGIRNVYVHDITFENSDCGLRMKSSKERGGFVEDVVVENLRMRNVQFPFSWIMDWHNAYNRKRFDNISELPDAWQAVARQIPEPLQMTKVRNIRIRHVDATLEADYRLPARAFDLVAFAQKPMEAIRFSHCRIEAKEFGRIVAVNDLRFDDVVVSVAGENNGVNDTFDNR